MLKSAGASLDNQTFSNPTITGTVTHITSPQYRQYNVGTVGDANYERGIIEWSSNDLLVGTDAGGTGSTARQMFLRGHGGVRFYTGTTLTARWIVDASGHLIGVADNTYDIGAAVATRPRTGYFGTSVLAPRVSNTAAPVTETGTTHTVAVSTSHLICNNAAAVTVTLPAAASFTGREIYIRAITANTVVSASSNVVPRIGGAAGTAIIGATDGGWALLVSDGTNWECMAGTP
jgi:hypothetical protein